MAQESVTIQKLEHACLGRHYRHQNGLSDVFVYMLLGNEQKRLATDKCNNAGQQLDM